MLLVSAMLTMLLAMGAITELLVVGGLTSMAGYMAEIECFWIIRASWYGLEIEVISGRQRQWANDQ